MFKYQVIGTSRKRRPMTIALTHFSDIADYIAAHAVEALDPNGENGLTVSVVTRPEADLFIVPPRENKPVEEE